MWETLSGNPLQRGRSHVHVGNAISRPEFLLTAPSLRFRSWKGENVATTEVEATLAMVNFIREVNVYGVSVPGEYRAVRRASGTKISIQGRFSRVMWATLL